MLINTALISCRRLGAAVFALLATITQLTAAEPRKPADPNEINAATGMASSMVTVAADGRSVVYFTRRGQAYHDLVTGKRANVSLEKHFNMFPPNGAWSPAGESFLLNEMVEGRNVISRWMAEDMPTGAPRQLMPIPRAMFARTYMIWSPDGKTGYFFIYHDLPWPKLPASADSPATVNNNVALAGSGAYRMEGPAMRVLEREYPGAYGEKNRTIIIALDVETGKFGVVGKGNDIDRVYLSPDGNHLVAVQMKFFDNADKDIRWAQQPKADVYRFDLTGVKFSDYPTIDLETSEDRKVGWSNHRGEFMQPIITDMLTAPTHELGTLGFPTIVWAPDSKRFAYATVGRYSTGDVYLYELASKQTRNLTEHTQLAPNTKGLGYDRFFNFLSSPKFGNSYNPLWMPDGRSLLALGKGELWSVSVDSNSPPKKLTGNIPHESIRVMARLDLREAALDAQDRVTLIAKDAKTRMDTLWKLNPSTGESSLVADTGIWIAAPMATIDRRGEYMYYGGQSVVSATNLHRVKLNAVEANAPTPQPEYVTKLKMQLADREYPETRQLEWTTADGYKGYGLLYLPKGASATNKAPMIIECNAGDRLALLDKRAATGAGFYSSNLHDQLKDGIAVLYADLPMSDWGVYEKPMQQSINAINAAVDAAISTGVVDETRLGILGYGYSGTAVYAALTDSARFKVAAVGSAISDLYGDYLGGMGKGANAIEHDMGEFRMAKPLWEDPTRFVENSPLTYFNRIKTPILIIHGQYDLATSMGHATESFAGLSLLNRDAIFARYARLMNPSNAESAIRVRGWFRQHLLGGPAITMIGDQGSYLFGGNAAATEGSPAPGVASPVAPSVPATVPSRN